METLLPPESATPAIPATPAIIPHQPEKFPLKTFGILTFWVVVSLGTLSVYYNLKQENQKLQLLTIINQAENRVLKAEIHSLEGKPSYEEGYKEALLKAGRPNSPGAYQDGYEAALKIIGDGGYVEGYHTAIKQFGYQPAKNVAFLVDEPTKSVTPTKKADK